MDEYLPLQGSIQAAQNMKKKWDWQHVTVYWSTRSAMNILSQT